MSSPDIKRVIVFDGGGIRGVFQAHFMSKLQDLDLVQQSHLMAGTSTGAIIAVCLALGKTPETICELYNSIGKQLFSCSSSVVRQLLFGHSAYSSEQLHDLLETHIKGKTSFGDCAKRVLVAATCLNDNSCQIFDSVNEQHKNIPAIDVILASTAAPTYFQPHHITCRSTLWADGGLTCNNPSYDCVLKLQSEGVSTNDIRVLSIANGRQPCTAEPDSFKNKKLFSWGKDLTSICMDVSSDQAHKRCTAVLPQENYLRVDPLVKQPIKLDDYKSATSILLPLAELTANEMRPSVRMWLD